MSRYRSVIVGLGNIATRRPAPASDDVLGTAIPNSHASAMAAIPEIEVVAGCDVSIETRNRFIEQWSPSWPGLRVYEDYREMFDRERPDLVSIATPDHLHCDPVISALAAGVRILFCEKPMATSLNDALLMTRAVAAAGATMSVNYTRRWTPEYVEARRLIRAGSIGRLSQIVIQYGGPLAMLYRIHTHGIDLMNYYAEEMPDWVIADLEPEFANYGTRYRGNGGSDPLTEPGSNFYLAYKEGTRAYLAGTKTMIDELRVDLIGSRARLTLDGEGMRLVTVEDNNSTGRNSHRVEHMSANWTVSGIEAAIRDLLESHEAGRPTASSPQSALQTVAITEAILRSQAQGNRPTKISGLA